MQASELLLCRLVSQPTAFATVLLSFFVLLFSSGCISHFGKPSGTETSDPKHTPCFKGLIRAIVLNSLLERALRGDLK